MDTCSAPTGGYNPSERFCEALRCLVCWDFPGTLGLVWIILHFWIFPDSFWFNILVFSLFLIWWLWIPFLHLNHMYFSFSEYDLKLFFLLLIIHLKISSFIDRLIFSNDLSWSGLRCIRSLFRCKAGIHPGWDARPSHAHTHSHLWITYCSQSIYWHGFGRFEETGEPSGNHTTHGENMWNSIQIVKVQISSVLLGVCIGHTHISTCCTLFSFSNFFHVMLSTLI